MVNPYRAGRARHAQEPAGTAHPHNGTQIDALVLSPKGAKFHELMPYKAPPDMSRFLLSPMQACWWMWPCRKAKGAGG